MEINSNLCSNAVRKIALLITKASDLGMDISGGFADENTSSGTAYLWFEDYSFTLFIGLGSDTIYALWTNFNNGEEKEIEADGKTLQDLLDWANALHDEENERV